MWQLALVSMIWAFSFGLIKGQLTGIDPSIVASIRLLLCLLCFAPFLFWAKSAKPNIKLIMLGALQFGVMYLLYIQSYQYLPGYLVAVFTIFTPLYVVLINAILTKSFNKQYLIPIASSILGAFIIVFKTAPAENFLVGFVLLQLANISFAIGQVGYRYVALNTPDRENMAWMYLGGAGLASCYCLLTSDFSQLSISSSQWGALLYLGIISSGLCFYLWNKGAKAVNAQTLAVMNNGYVPFAVIFAVTLFSEQADWLRLAIGGGFIAFSVYWAQRKSVAS